MSKEINLEEIGEQIKKVRLKKGLSQQQLADRIGITRSAVSHLEGGLRGLRLESLIQTANALEVTTDELLGNEVKTIFDKYDVMAKKVLEDCSKTEREFLLKSLRHLKDDLRDYLDDIIEEKRLSVKIQESKK